MNEIALRMHSRERQTHLDRKLKRNWIKLARDCGFYTRREVEVVFEKDDGRWKNVPCKVVEGARDWAHEEGDNMMGRVTGRRFIYPPPPQQRHRLLRRHCDVDDDDLNGGKDKRRRRACERVKCKIERNDGRRFYCTSTQDQFHGRTKELCSCASLLIH